MKKRDATTECLEGAIDGFARRRLPGEGVEIDALVGGSGPPLLLLHGFPQTRVMWRTVAPALAARFTLVMPDLRGYGRSGKPASAGGAAYAKRIMARDQIATMKALGFERFAVAGHDRGGRVAYRLALDAPEAVSRLALLDVLPTGDIWAAADAGAAMRAYHWYFLAQPAPFPENMIGADPDVFLGHTLTSWAGAGFAFDPRNLADYRACFRAPDALRGACEDYRAGWLIDRRDDEADRAAGRRIAAPVLALWARDYGLGRADPVAAWRRWADDVTGREVPGGHFIAEEAPDEVAAALLAFLGG